MIFSPTLVLSVVINIYNLVKGSEDIEINHLQSPSSSSCSSNPSLVSEEQTILCVFTLLGHIHLDYLSSRFTSTREGHWILPFFLDNGFFFRKKVRIYWKHLTIIKYLNNSSECNQKKKNGNIIKYLNTSSECNQKKEGKYGKMQGKKQKKNG